MADPLPHEILPGVVHWTTIHPRIGIEVSSYALPAERVLIDPLLPPAALEWLDERPPAAVLLTNRHHYRDSGVAAARWGCSVHCHRAGLHEFRRGEQVEPFDPGDELPGGLRAVAVGALCPDESALFSPAHRALWVADGVIREPPDGPLGFVPDAYMGEDPEGVKRGLAEAYAALCALGFDHLLPAHGRPLLSEGRPRLEEFAARARGG